MHTHDIHPRETLVLRLKILDGECWWGGAVADGTLMPFGASSRLERDLATNSGRIDAPDVGCNQSSPLLVSSRGRVVHGEAPFTFRFEEGELVIDGEVDVQQAPVADLPAAVRLAASTAYTPSGTTPAEELFTAPSYNVWMEMPFFPSQETVIDYARRLLDAGFPPGVLIIDDNWANTYGDWTFDPGRFPDPAAMVAELGELGFPVMLWIAPYVTPDSTTFRTMRHRGMLLSDASGEVAIREWWNGFGAIMDLTNPETVSWCRERLQALRADFGIAGFKFDGGDLRDYRPGDGGRDDAPVAQCYAWSQIGLEFDFNEFRSTWSTGGWPLMQRLSDKPAVPFGIGGIDTLIPEGIAQGLLGYPFACPDLIGGGEIGTASSLGDEEFMVRYTQCAALFPLVQFSVNPARVLGERALEHVREAIAVRSELMPELMDLIRNAATTGEPVLRPLAYHFAGTEAVTDQFLLGDSIMVAPVIEQGATSRTITIPQGRWRDDTGAEIVGPATITRAVDLGTFPRYRRLDTPLGA